LKYVILYAAVSGHDFGLNYTVKTLADTFDELNISTEELNIGFLDIPYFDGINSSAVENVFEKIRRSDGVIFAMTASKNAPCALMQTFIEHFDFNVYKNPFEGKNCFTVILSGDESQLKAEEYMTDIISSSSAVPAVRLSAGKSYIPLFGKDEQVKEMIEKYAEEFYRMKNRKLFTSYASKITEAPKIKNFSKNDAVNFNINNFNEKQEEDINELTRLFSKQYKAESEKRTNVNKNIIDMYENNMTVPKNSKRIEQDMFSPKIKPSIKTCKQKTQNLHHYFQPQYAENINAVIQINISGDENFSGYVTLFNGLCSYDDGVHNAPDVVIFADTKVWNDILDAKYTVQKAFMIGQIKVKGNFMLLSHFDKAFKLKQQ